MNLKAIILSILVLGLIGGAGGGWWAWGKWTAYEERGVSLGLKVAPSAEERKELEKAYNELLDRDELLQPVVNEVGLISFYGVETEGEAVEQLRLRSKVFFKDPETIYIVHGAERRERELNDRLGRVMGDAFVQVAFPRPPE